MSDAAEPVTAATWLRASRGRLELPGEHLARLGVARGTATDEVEARLDALHRSGGARDGVYELRRAGGADVEIAPLRPPRFDGERLAEGVALLQAGERPALAPQKTLAAARHAESLLARARAHGADELLWRSSDGALLGATTMNLFLLDGATLLTPSLASGAWPGLLRRAVLQAARELSSALALSIREERLAAAALDRADDAFLASAAEGLVAVRSIDGRALRAPPRGAPARAIVPKLRLRLFELCGARTLPPAPPA
jgi:4-amino-4-deoxychorismate lyase